MSMQKPTSGKDRLSEELGVDVENLEAQLRLRRDLSRVHDGTPTEMGYIKITRQDHPDALVVFDTPEQAADALDDHPLINSLCEEDCLDAWVVERLEVSDLYSIEVILA